MKRAAIWPPWRFLFHIQYRYFRDCPAVVGAGYLKLHHGNGVGGAAHNTETTTDTLLFVDNHIRSAHPVLGSLVQWIALDDTRETFHADTVVWADVHAARTED